MNEDLRGRVSFVVRDLDQSLLRYTCRAATLNGVAVDFMFALGFDDPRIEALRPGNRVLYSTQGTKGVWGAVRVPGFDQWIPCDGITTQKVPGRGDAPPSFRESLLFAECPEPAIVARVEREAARMGYGVEFGVGARAAEDLSTTQRTPYVEIQVPGRGNVRHWKDADVTWEETLIAAGLGGTL